MQALLCIKYMLVHERTLPAKWCTRILLIRTTESEQTVFSCCPKVAAWRREALSKASNSITRNSNFRPCFQPNCVRAPIFMRRKRDLNCLVPQNRNWFAKLQWKQNENSTDRKKSALCNETVFHENCQLSPAAHWTWILFFLLVQWEYFLSIFLIVLAVTKSIKFAN